MVRDPIERFISLFYYHRTRVGSKCHTHKLPPEWCYKDINKCITSGDRECQFNPESRTDETPETEDLEKHQIPFFCGSSPECKLIGSKVALQKGIT